MNYKAWKKTDMPDSGHNKFVEICYIYDIKKYIYYSKFRNWKRDNSAIAFVFF